MSRFNRGARRRGAAMMFTFLALMVFTILGMALTSASMNAVRISRFQRQSSEAFNIAESAADKAMLWLVSQATPPSGTSWQTLYGTTSMGDGSYSVTYTGDSNNPNTELKRYTIRAVALVGTRQETVEIFLQQSNFGRYAYFTDYERSSYTNSAIWFKSGEVVDGPAHSNNTDDSDFHINYVGSTTSIFKDLLTASGDAINYNPGSPTVESDFLKVYAAGSRGYHLNVPRVELPETSDKQRNAAWGASTEFPTTDGVYINADGSVPRGGIYIRGDSTVQFVGTGTTQVVQITSGSTRYKVTVDRTNNTTTVRQGDGDWDDSNGGGTVTSYSGLPNGVIYTTGNITSLKGTLADSKMDGSNLVTRNAWTVATDIVNNKDVTITDNLTYNTQPDKTQSWSDTVNLRAAALGVVARNIKMDAPTTLTVNGVMLAGGRNTTDGSFYNVQWSSDSPGALNLVGGIIQKKRGPVGTFNSSTGVQSTGYQKNYSYDRRMRVNPPPYFPTIFGYDRLSWARLSGGFKPTQQIITEGGSGQVTY